MVAQDTLYFFAWIWIGVAVATFIVLRFVSAPYGRHTRQGWGPTVANRLGWIVMELPGLTLMPLLFFLGPVEKTAYHWLVLGLYEAHYIHRALIFPFRLRTRGKRMPAAIVGSAVFFNLVNGFLMGAWLGWYATAPKEAWIQGLQIFGGFLFVVGAYINLRADTTLIALRKGSDTGYKIPQGVLFRRVSCPNLMGEMIEWIGYALIAWNVAALSFAIWTIANLLPRALDHHAWYRRTFADYPPERKAVLPYVL